MCRYVEQRQSEESGLVFSEIDAVVQHLFPDLKEVLFVSVMGGMRVLLEEGPDEVDRRLLTATAGWQLILLDHVGTNIMSLNKTMQKKPSQ